MAGNSNLSSAKNAKNDEFYTSLEDIEAEIGHFEDKFQGQTVFCNCDDPTWSNFWRFFHLNFERLGLKKLISTHYEPGPVQTYMMEYQGGDDLNFNDGIRTDLSENGDFRSPECLKLLDESDIVVTNPPFSIARQYFVPTLIEHKKKFLIIGDLNWISYKNIFPLIQNNEMWFGFNSVKKFRQPDNSFKKFGNKLWFTNLDHSKRHELLETPYLFSRKNDLYPDLYQKYDNYDAIEVGKVKTIPMDYDGVMGVPITFVSVYNPKQYKILGITKTWFGAATKVYPKQTQINKDGSRQIVTKLNDGPVEKISAPIDKVYYEVDGTLYKQDYARILIERK